MSQMGQTGIKPAARSNIYTVLVAIALLALIGGIVAVWLRGKELYGSSNPFDMVVEIKEPVKAKAVSPSAPAADTAAPTTGATTTPPAEGTAPTTGTEAAPAQPPAQ